LVKEIAASGKHQMEAALRFRFMETKTKIEEISTEVVERLVKYGFAVVDNFIGRDLLL
jgi:hypothetical protein